MLLEHVPEHALEHVCPWKQRLLIGLHKPIKIQTNNANQTSIKETIAHRSIGPTNCSFTALNSTM
jgi:hypothetical protein